MRVHLALLAGGDGVGEEAAVVGEALLSAADGGLGLFLGGDLQREVVFRRRLFR